MIKIALCDNDGKALPVIAGAVDSAFRAQGMRIQICKFKSGSELMAAMEETTFQLILLDIDMPKMDGITVAKKIREQYGSEVEITFVSECEDRVFDALLTQPLGFVRKSNFLNDIAALVRLYQKKCSESQSGKTVEFATKSGLLRLKSSQIRYIEGSRNTQLLYLSAREEPTEIRMTMEKLEEMLESDGFIRIHKGYLVNFQFVQRIHSNQVTLQDGIILPIGRSKMEEVKRKYISLLGN